jgi:hypothetical protein
METNGTHPLSNRRYGVRPLYNYGFEKRIETSKGNYDKRTNAGTERITFESPTT